MSGRPTTDLEMLAGPNFIENDFRLRLACDLHLERLGLTWKSPRVKFYLASCCGWPNAILADADRETLLALMGKLQAEPTPPDA